MTRRAEYSRRKFLRLAGQLAVLSVLSPFPPGSLAAADTPLLKPIPKTGEMIPAIGMGTWITFNVGNNAAGIENCTQVLKAFFAAGGSMIDSSPMYGSSEQTVGYVLDKLDAYQSCFSATKVWTPFQSQGQKQIADSQRLWGVPVFDLFQVHNLVAWKEHLETLLDMKQNKQVRYVGITTSHGRRHQELEQIITTQPIDFVQLTYNVLDREVEQRLLPAAKDHGVAVIANRPFQRGGLFDHIGNAPLPGWAREFDCDNWAQFLLKFIISHPAVTCAIPATSQVIHMQENMGALYGSLPDQQMRHKMAAYVATL